ncbi:uncharacterized protein OCT59_021520 [Rhizophagus irregularis]|uniref:Gcn5p n=2 Tax=Rhizophagus irregularis TaxID=588596 RepID=A0A015JJ45_RHIIW|nr:hypothetical protein GLOIN_2v1824437 [Rhizophagus irregularis DAOM 181602=DAOM 197198]EXX69517.1 Gcn5p [Rhizophagus irregularis DAOM 197198w]UZO27974.1 hypothetical protein OCT59_021520 [Rhizophagus irregularis]POG75170.1 hypothetical protein GLOIN_2v1824437 [Rhizophagus irregularis DAOM 181602=DAOM 197198]CAG8452165.1 5567_t:CDS:2 [Rhizophagus irregularis]GBC15988.2 bromodomain-containing protein [Rhizophagus irregularis DAOM 181602=DAOM 197198]|eukprot:XP_025182036.1 hypothetical protein GLOIN_2v1824437 [Rhizophagus irregularis DAOM 181602=DAOM 197198]
MSLIINSYLCKNQLMKYLLHNRTNLSYREFLTEYHDLIYIASFPYISSLPFSNWKTFDDYWADKFLDEANDLIKEKKILKKSTIDILKEKINKERLQQEKYLQIYWQEVIKNYKAENLIPGATYTKKTIRKTLTKDNINPDLMFCYDILYELENTIWAYPFYKFDKKSDIYNQIINPMDLFTINLKLENNQYSNPFEFKYDMNLIFNNCRIINDVESEMHNIGINLKYNFDECWNFYFYQKDGGSNILEQELFSFDLEDDELEDIEPVNNLNQQLIQQLLSGNIRLEDIQQLLSRNFRLEDIQQLLSRNIRLEDIESEDIESEIIELGDIEEDIEPDIEPEDFLYQNEQEIDIEPDIEPEDFLYQNEQEIPKEVEQEECEDLYQQFFSEDIELENIEPDIELFPEDIESEDIEPNIKPEDFLYQQFFQIESEDIELENKQKEQEIPEEVEQECDENFQIKQQIEEYDKIQIEQEYQNQINHQEIISQINEKIFQIE